MKISEYNKKKEKKRAKAKNKIYSGLVFHLHKQAI